MLEIKNLHKEFESHVVLQEINFKVRKGEVAAVLGPSGSGKTTMLRCISFLERVNAGEMIFDGISYDMAHLSSKQIRECRMQMGFVFQSFNLFNNMTALGNVMEGLTIARKMEKKAAEELAYRMLKKVDMQDRALYYPAQLSGGQKQRVAIARAIAASPKVILFDEPTSALDPELTGEVLEVIRKLADEGTTMVVVTHEIHFAKDVANRIAFVENGVVVEEAPSDEFFTHPREERTIQFLQGAGVKKY